MVVYRKVKLDGPSWEDVEPNFPRYKELFLGLLETKEKLKEGLPPIPLPSYEGNAMKKQYTNENENLEFSASENDNQDENEETEEEEFSDESFDEEDDELLEALGKNTKLTESSEEDEDQDESDGNMPEQDSVDEQEEKQEYMFRLKMLKRRDGVVLPPYSEHSHIDDLKRIYNQTMREIALESNCTNLKGYLTGGFLLTEFVFTRIIGIDMTGFAESQISNMNQYDQLLLEMGEKQYMQFGSNLPVEVRLMGLIVFNAAVFYMGNMFKNSGSDIGNSFLNTFFGGGIKPSSKEGTTTKKRKGPSVKVDDIKNMQD